MKNHRVRSKLRTIVAILSVVGIVSACSHAPEMMSSNDPQQAYSQAIRDAAVAEPDEISKNLVAIIPSNDALQWNRATGEVLVVTWTSWDGYDDHVGGSMPLAREVWITVVPEMVAFCREQQIEPSQVTLRLEQVLGLPPGNGKTKFVEMWVAPDDLFRPAPDPAISDHEAELDFPVSNRFVTISKDYQQWFNDLARTSYGANGYPWTRLGYTYDWGNPESEIGLSEFVIRSGAVVKIHSVTGTSDYCR